MTRLQIILAMVLAVAAVLASPAAGATLQMDGGRLLYLAAPGEINRLQNPHFEAKAPLWEFFGGSAPLATGSGCELTSAEQSIAECDPALPLAAALQLGDGDDLYRQSGIAHSENDGPLIYDPLDEPLLLTVEGETGNDEFWVTPHGGPLSLYGGPGNDRFQYTPQATSGTFGLPGRFLLAGGEGDDWLQVHGGDTPAPAPGSTLTLEGGAGNDWAMGSKGDDVILGGPGSDRLFDQAGNDLIDGGEGDDLVTGGYGADLLSGGPGNDELQANGDERLDGGSGDDRIRAKNGGPDQISCGEGFDKVELDLLVDVVTTDCERFMPSEKCKRWGVTCRATISTKALAPGRPLLGRTQFRFRGVSMGGNRLPLSNSGRAYVQRAGLITVIRTTRISQPRREGKPRVTVKQETINLTGA